MKKFLNFSTILFSYVLITLLVISCGGSSGGGGGTGGTGGNGGNGGGSVPQPEPKDTTCLLVDRADKDSLVAVLCSEGVVIDKITKQNSIQQNTKFLIPSTENTAGTTTSRTWDISKKDAQIQISYNKDYTLTVADGGTAGPIGTLSDAEGHTAEYPLKILTIPSMLNDVENASGKNLRAGSMVFQSSSSRISATLKVSLAVKSQADFISMANFSLPELSASSGRLSFTLANNLDLVANGSDPDAKFDNAIIPVSDASFNFDGGGYTISLNSEIDTTASGNQAAIIGEIKKSAVFRDFILDINKSISGSRFVGTVLAHSDKNVINKLHGIKVNINSNINAVKMGSDDAHAGGLAGSTCSDINLVVVKTADGVAIRAAAIETVEGKVASIGGVVGYAECYVGGRAARIINSVVDVTLGAYNAGVAYLGSNINMGGLGDRLDSYYEFTNNIVKLKIYRDANLPTNFAFDKVAGFVSRIKGIDEVANNLAYVDFSNLGQVKNVGGLFGEADNTSLGNTIFNNMLFIADGFNPGNVTEKFGAAITNVMGNGSVLNFTDTFVSSPVSDYNDPKLASFVHTANKEINFTNLILDNKEAAVMFKDGEALATVKNKVTADNLSTFAEGVDSTVATTLKASDQWDAGSGGYPQLIPVIRASDFSDFNKNTNNEIAQAWTETNTDLQAKLAARANK